HAVLPRGRPACPRRLARRVVFAGDHGGLCFRAGRRWSEREGPMRLPCGGRRHSSWSAEVGGGARAVIGPWRGTRASSGVSHVTAVSTNPSSFGSLRRLTRTGI